MPPVDLDPRIAEQLRQSRVMQAYRDLFGPEEKNRSDIQRIVWEDLKIAGYYDLPVFIPDKSGALCPIRGGIADGRRSLFLYIRSNVMFAPDIQQPQQQQ